MITFNKAIKTLDSRVEKVVSDKHHGVPQSRRRKMTALEGNEIKELINLSLEFNLGDRESPEI